MEFIYFIAGVLVTGLIYGVILLRRVRIKLDETESSLQHTLNISSLRYVDIEDKLKELNSWVQDMKSEIEASSFESVGELTKRLGKVEQVMGEVKKSIDTLATRGENRYVEQNNEIMQLKTNFKALAQDPNFLNRYQ